MNLDNFFYYKLGASFLLSKFFCMTFGSFLNWGHHRALIILWTLMLDSQSTYVTEIPYLGQPCF